MLLKIFLTEKIADELGVFMSTWNTRHPSS